MTHHGRFGAAIPMALTMALTVALSSPALAQTASDAQKLAPAAASAAQVTLLDKNPTQPDSANSLASKAIATVKQATTKAADIFNRVPCRAPKGGVKPMGSLPHVARKLVERQPVVIIAFGSSSTEGYGSTSPEFTYPNRLAEQLRRKYPGAEITVLNRGRGGEAAPEMMQRLKHAVIDEHPDLVIWQVGTNAILRNLNPSLTVAQVEEGIARIQAAASDVVLVDPQYVPAVNQKAESAGRMVKMLNAVAHAHHIGIFPRFEVMRDWHEKQDLAFDRFSIADGLHMNDWGYACFAQLLGDDIIRSVGQIQIGVNVPSNVLTYRPL